MLRADCHRNFHCRFLKHRAQTQSRYSLQAFDRTPRVLWRTLEIYSRGLDPHGCLNFVEATKASPHRCGHEIGAATQNLQIANNAKHQAAQMESQNIKIGWGFGILAPISK